MATLRFLGATETVTGSKYVLDAGGTRVMIDCGLFQGIKELRLRNREPLPVEAESIDYVILTHAHVDHSGYLPKLIKDGFRGPVVTTAGTAALLGILLPDAGHLQEEDAEYANAKGFSKHHPALPLYTEDDARAALAYLRGTAYDHPVQLGDAITVRFLPAGHILGSGFAEVTVAEPDKKPFTILFSGDIGGYDEPILVDPTPVEGADYLLVESTYGDRLHETDDPKEQLAAIIKKTVKRGGKVIIPAFAVGRTQLLVYLLRELEDEKRIPVLPVIVDSPMAVATTKLYGEHPEEYDEAMRELVDRRRDPLATHDFRLVSDLTESRTLDTLHGPAIILSASGMATGGRVLHHLARMLPDHRNTLVIVGHQAEETRGRKLQDGAHHIKIHGEMVRVAAEIETIASLSAHADAGEIMRWLAGFTRAPKLTFVVHGEPEAARSLRNKIENQLGWKAVVPTYGETVELGAD